MTTQVHVAVSGNKQVVVSCTNGHDGKVSKTLMQPGAHHIFLIHGDAKIEAQEVGDFINTPSLPLVRPLVEDENKETSSRVSPKPPMTALPVTGEP